MGEERKIYPLKFCSIRDERPWGYEEFKLADLGYKDSLIREGWLAGNSMGELMDTYIDRIAGDTVYEYYGRQFPVCVRLLRLTGKMPLQVHPDDETAEQRYDLLGKEKLWYILKAGKGGRLHIGFRKDTDAGAFCENCGADRADTMLTDIVPVEGQSFLIPAGTPHCADGELEILEIAESSPLDFCLHGRGMEVSEDQFDPSLGFTDALDFISYRKYVPDNGRGAVLAEIPQFSIRKLEDAEASIRAAINERNEERRQAEQRIAEAREAIERWKARARLAAAKGRDDLAREAIAERLELERRKEKDEQLCITLSDVIESLQATLERTEKKLAELIGKADGLKARSEGAKARAKATKAERMDWERKIAEAEDRIKAWEAMSGSGRKESGRSFEDMERDEEIENELERLKEEVSHDTSDRAL